MTACLSDNVLVEMLEGCLSEERIREVHQHLDVCGSCRSLLATLAGEPEDSAEQTPEQASTLSAAAAPSSNFTPPEQLDEYRLVKPLGRGAMGQVYLGHDTLLDREVAIKFMLSVRAEERERARFLIEARALARLSHANVVTVHRVGEFQGHQYLVAEFVRGQSLAALDKPMPPTRVLTIGIGLARGLAAAHLHDILHRDIKPANAMLQEDGTVKLLDFGLAKLPGAAIVDTLQAGRSADPTDRGRAGWGDTEPPALTRTGTLVGTPLYMAPELWRGEPATCRSDVFSLGAVLYELCSGRSVYTANSLHELSQLAPSHDATPLAVVAPTVDKPLAAVIDRCLRRDPLTRYESGAELCAALESLVPTRPRASRRRRAGVLAAGAVLLASFVGTGMYVVRRPAVRAPREPSMAQIPGGTFQMGSSADEIQAAHTWCKTLAGDDCPRDLFEREQPVRKVTISPFRLDVTEVTNEQFAAWLNRRKGLHIRDARWVEDGGVLLADLYPPYTPWHGLVIRGNRISTYPGIENKPATQLTWDAAQRYCADLGKRLPTEAEWEFAARGLEQNRFPWGFEEPSCDGVVFARGSGQACAQPGLGPRDVGTSRQDRTPQGVFDLGGNASEWVADAFAERYPPCGDCINPEVHSGAAAEPAAAPLLRVFRGGNWLFSAPTCRVAARSRWEQNQAPRTVGFRCAQSGWH